MIGFLVNTGHLLHLETIQTETQMEWKKGETRQAMYV
jgi:hypothetical protein